MHCNISNNYYYKIHCGLVLSQRHARTRFLARRHKSIYSTLTSVDVQKCPHRQEGDNCYDFHTVNVTEMRGDEYDLLRQSLIAA